MKYTATFFKTYLDYYYHKVTPSLEDIDIYLRSGEDSFPVTEVSRLLYITPNELAHIMDEKQVTFINKENFFEIMRHGSSDICQLYHREVERRSPFIYTPADIAYIYQLDEGVVGEICRGLGFEQVTSSLLPMVFGKISLV